MALRGSAVRVRLAPFIFFRFDLPGFDAAAIGLSVCCASAGENLSSEDGGEISEGSVIFPHCALAVLQ